MKIVFDSEEEMNRVVNALDCPSTYGFKDTFKNRECLENECDVCIKTALKMEVKNNLQCK